MHVKAAEGGKDNRVVPLLLLHGWPGSFVEFYDLLPLLTSERKGDSVILEVICPSIPGYGFSQASAKQGLCVQGESIPILLGNDDQHLCRSFSCLEEEERQLPYMNGH